MNDKQDMNIANEGGGGSIYKKKLVRNNNLIEVSVKLVLIAMTH